MPYCQGLASFQESKRKRYVVHSHKFLAMSHDIGQVHLLLDWLDVKNITLKLWLAFLHDFIVMFLDVVEIH